MTTGLTRGAFTGRETKLYINTADYDTPTWVEVARARNIQFTDGPVLSDVEFHGATSTGNIPGYGSFSGSFEYVEKRGTDTVLAALETAQRARDIVECLFCDQDRTVTGAKCWQAPVLIGEFSVTANGNDPEVKTIPFGKADAFDSSGDSVEVTYPVTA